MTKLFPVVVVAVFAVLMVGTSAADLVDNSGGPISPPDNNPAGATSSIVIGANQTISDVDVTLFGASHTWVGDLIATITHVDTGTSVTLFSRTGGGSGDSSDLGGTYTFSDGGDDWWQEAFDRTFAEPLTPGTYQATDINNIDQFLATAFAGESTAGTWTLFLSDNSADDTGSIQSWGLSFTSTVIPEPASALFLGAAGAALLIRRRR
jgi:subtilisin-like proprotein convertase family protein